MNFREGILVLFVNNVFCEEIVRYNFAEDFELNFFNNEAPCTGLPLWNLVKYSSIDIELLNHLSERYITPLVNLSCVSSFQFSMSVGGTLEINVYMDSADFVITDLVAVLAEQIILDDNNANVGTAFYTSESPNFMPGWQTLSIQVFGSLFETFDGRIVLMGMADPNSIVLVDSFCYKPPNFDGDCWADDKTTITESITPTVSTTQTILEQTTPTIEVKEVTTIQPLETESTPESETEPTLLTVATPTTDSVTDFTTVTITEISTVSKPTTELEIEPTSLAETEIATVTRIELTTTTGIEVTTETEIESTTRTETKSTTDTEVYLTSRTETESTTESETETTTDLVTKLTSGTETEPLPIYETDPTTLTIKDSTIIIGTNPTTLSETEPTIAPETEQSTEIEPTTAAPTVTNPDSTSPTLENRCPDWQVHRLLPHEENCGLFYNCNWGEKILMVCPSGLHFNPIIQVCDWPQNAGCATN